MTLQKQLMNEIKDLPLEAQEKLLKLILFVKKEILVSAKGTSGRKATNPLSDVDNFAIETGIPDLATQHDHYLYGVPKR